MAPGIEPGIELGIEFDIPVDSTLTSVDTLTLLRAKFLHLIWGEHGQGQLRVALSQTSAHASGLRYQNR